jgi:hypothetical protein
MNTRHKLISDLMNHEAIKALSEDEQRNIYNQIAEIVKVAQLEVVEDAEKAISKLRTFSIR